MEAMVVLSKVKRDFQKSAYWCRNSGVVVMYKPWSSRTSWGLPEGRRRTRMLPWGESGFVTQDVGHAPGAQRG